MPRGSDLDRLVRSLDTAETRVMGGAARAVQGALKQLVDAGYAKSRDVKGKPYIPPKDGHRPPMIRSGKLRGAYRYAIHTGALLWRVTVGEDTTYGEYLRDGTSKMEPRQHIPRPGEPLPSAWDAKVQRDLSAAVQREARR